MRILLIADSYPDDRCPAQGAFFHARAAAYRERGHAVAVLAQSGELPECVTYRGVPVYRPRTEPEIAAVLAACRPEVLCIHAPNPSTRSGALLARYAGEYPTVVWIHGWESMRTAFLHYYASVRKSVSACYKDWLRLSRLGKILPRATAVVYVSAWMRRTSEAHCGCRHPFPHVIPNPIDTRHFAPTAAPRAPGPLRGISVRSLANPKYGIDLAVRAFAGLPETSLTVVGSGALLARYTALAAKLHAPVAFHTDPIHNDAMPALLGQYDYFVAPSRTETHGVAMCEAMSCGLPVVATRVGGIPEYVRDGIDGWLVPPEPAALHGALRQLLAAPSRLAEMGAQARAYVREQCDVSLVAAAEERVMREAIDRFHATRGGRG